MSSLLLNLKYIDGKAIAVAKCSMGKRLPCLVLNYSKYAEQKAFHAAFFTIYTCNAENHYLVDAVLFLLAMPETGDAGTSNTPGKECSTPVPNTVSLSAPPAKRRRRDMRACASCRRSKVKCDGDRPCKRCANINAECTYHEVTVDPMVERMAALESQLQSLQSKIDQLENPNQSSGVVDAVFPDVSRDTIPTNGKILGLPTLQSQTEGSLQTLDAISSGSLSVIGTQYELQGAAVRNGKAWRTFRRRDWIIPNAVEKGIVTEEQAQTWFAT